MPPGLTLLKPPVGGAVQGEVWEMGQGRSRWSRAHLLVFWLDKIRWPLRVPQLPEGFQVIYLVGLF